MEHRTWRFPTASGARIYGLPVRAFTGLVANVYLVVDGAYAALVDAGSGSADSNADIQTGFAALAAEWDERIALADIDRIIVTHGHVDHYGGLGWVRQQSAAPVAVHRLDAAVVRDPQTALAQQATAVAAFLRRCGVGGSAAEQLGGAWGSMYRHLGPATVADELDDGDCVDGRFTAIHTPGHCAGQVCLRYADVLFCADHVLALTNPRLTPAALEPHNGMAAYLAALDRIAAEPDIRLALAGHEAPMDDLYARIVTLRAAHLARLEQILGLGAAPRTIAEISAAIYPEQQRGVGLLLTAQATAARVEYLLEQGRLAVHDRDAAAPRFFPI